MQRNDSPFSFAERATDPTGRALAPATTTPAPRRRRSRATAAATQESADLEDLLRKAIREVTERQVRQARSVEELVALLALHVDDSRRRVEGNS